MNDHSTPRALHDELNALWKEIKSMAAPTDAAPASFNEIERGLFAGLLALGRNLLEHVLALAAAADQPHQHVVHDGRLYDRRQSRTKDLRSVFGILTYWRWVYYSAESEHGHDPLAARLNLPAEKASYFVQELLSAWATGETDRAAVDYFHRLFGQSVSTRSVQEYVAAAAEHAAAYAAQRPLPEADGEILVASVDGKGVPMRPADRLDAEGTKRQSLVGVVYQTDALPREPLRLAAGLAGWGPAKECVFGDDPPRAPAPPRARGAQYVAHLTEKEQTIDEVAALFARRRQPGQKCVALLDGDHYLRDLLADRLSGLDALILDIQHASGYLARAAQALGVSEPAAAHFFLLAKVLNGQAAEVADELAAIAAGAACPASRREVLHKTVTYLRNHLDMMHYDEYLAAGYPIGSGVIESACGHVVRQRLEVPGARWSLPGAEAMLCLRAVRQSGEWEAYHHWRRQQEHRHRYAPRAA